MLEKAGRFVDLSAQLKALQSNAGVKNGGQITKLVTLVEQVIGGSGAQIQRIEYHAGRGWMLLISASSFTDLEQLRERGISRGLPVKLGSTSKEHNRVAVFVAVSFSTLTRFVF